MHRDDSSKFLLYIEPKKEEKLDTPIEDNLTKLMEMALSKAQKGTGSYSDTTGEARFRPGSGFKGSHRTECGERSSNVDFLLENGMITNSLAPFYLRWYRYSIPESDMMKLKELAKFYNYEI
jgi:hypothetical protein